jgi:hypothetical protein
MRSAIETGGGGYLLPTHGDYYLSSRLIYGMGETEVFLLIYLFKGMDEGLDGEAKTRNLGPV